jgi:hypothetical protein
VASGVVGDSVRWRAHDSGWLAGCVRAVTTGKRGRGRRAWMNILERELEIVFRERRENREEERGLCFCKVDGVRIPRV